MTPPANAERYKNHHFPVEIISHGVWLSYRFTLSSRDVQELLFEPGERHYLWRAVDQDDNVLDILVQRRRNKQAAKKFFRKLLKGLLYVPRVIITDKLKSYGAAKREMLPGVEHRQSRYLNDPCDSDDICYLCLTTGSRDEETIRELGRNHGHGVGCLRDRQGQDRLSMWSMRVSASTS